MSHFAAHGSKTTVHGRLFTVAQQQKAASQVPKNMRGGLLCLCRDAPQSRASVLPAALFDHAHAVDCGNLLEGLDGRGIQVLVGIEHGVGVFAGALVDHALHVGVVLGKDGRDLTDHIGHVCVQAGNTACGARLAHAAGGVINGVDDIAVLQVILELGNGHIGAVCLGLAGAGA